MPRLLRKVLSTRAPWEVALIRLLVGAVFLSEGIQKFLFPEDLGMGRFEKIGIPLPEFFAPFVGMIEVSGGLLLLLGFLTRPFACLLLFDMLVAVLSTKLPIFFRDGFWKMAHESRTDWSMIWGLMFLIVVGAGSLSVDAKIMKAR